jgi:Uma2 family endonuclease
MHTEVTKKRFTVEEYYKLDEAGILSPEVRTELIDGEIIEVTRMGPRHASVLSRVTHLFVELFDRKVVIRSQLPFGLGIYTELEPDLALFRVAGDFYSTNHPGPEDAILVLEIADSSLTYDREVKLKVYAAADVPEVWIADLRGDSLLVFRDPSSTNYKTSLSFKREDSVSCLSFPEIRFSVHELLP